MSDVSTNTSQDLDFDHRFRASVLNFCSHYTRITMTAWARVEGLSIASDYWDTSRNMAMATLLDLLHQVIDLTGVIDECVLQGAKDCAAVLLKMKMEAKAWATKSTKGQPAVQKSAFA